ncbi:hypothetical protein [Paenibacillus contaminans]|uniref:Uncharacterized protein n=1 Tax=Paenibacillus contaminans TaxID=450362 RepID=A0A329MBK5_9BACL|nr:hypothetical protein [Paenibacillus contaminans]RAV14417.1 hypothetical protein DQG23_31490 [Paenibacillus contaminans]
MIVYFEGDGTRNKPINSIADAIEKALGSMGIDAAERNLWYFSSVGEYAALLEKSGFRVRGCVGGNPSHV